MQSLTTLWKGHTLFIANSWYGDYFSVCSLKLRYTCKYVLRCKLINILSNGIKQKYLFLLNRTLCKNIDDNQLP